MLPQGVRGLYRGYRSTVLREVGQTQLFFSSTLGCVASSACSRGARVNENNYDDIRFTLFNRSNFNSAPIWQLIYCIRVILCICNPSGRRWIACKFFLIRLEKPPLFLLIFEDFSGASFSRLAALIYSSPPPPILIFISFIYLSTSFCLLEASLSRPCN